VPSRGQSLLAREAMSFVSGDLRCHDEAGTLLDKLVVSKKGGAEGGAVSVQRKLMQLSKRVARPEKAYATSRKNFPLLRKPAQPQ